MKRSNFGQNMILFNFRLNITKLIAAVVLIHFLGKNELILSSFVCGNKFRLRIFIYKLLIIGFLNVAIECKIFQILGKMKCCT